MVDDGFLGGEGRLVVARAMILPLRNIELIAMFAGRQLCLER